MYLARGTGEDFFTLSSLIDADCSDLSLLSAKEDCCMDCLLEPVEACNPYTLMAVGFECAVGAPSALADGGAAAWLLSLKAYTSSSDPARSLGDGLDADGEGVNCSPGAKVIIRLSALRAKNLLMVSIASEVLRRSELCESVSHFPRTDTEDLVVLQDSAKPTKAIKSMKENNFFMGFMI